MGDQQPTREEAYAAGYGIRYCVKCSWPLREGFGVTVDGRLYCQPACRRGEESDRLREQSWQGRALFEAAWDELP